MEKKNDYVKHNELDKACTRIIKFLNVHGVQAVLNVGLTLNLVVSCEQLERMTSILRYYGIWFGKPRQILNKQNFALEVNREVIDGITKHTELLYQSARPIMVDIGLEVNSSYSVPGLAKVFKFRLPRHMTNMHRIAASYALITLLCIDGQIDLPEICTDDIEVPAGTVGDHLTNDLNPNWLDTEATIPEQDDDDPAAICDNQFTMETTT